MEVKRISLVRLRRDLSRATCIERWAGEHAEIMRALPGVLEYTVDLATDSRPADSWDAVVTVRFADEASFQHFQIDPQIKERLLATREDFAEAVDVFLVDEHTFIPRGGSLDR